MLITNVYSCFVPHLRIAKTLFWGGANEMALLFLPGACQPQTARQTIGTPLRQGLGSSHSMHDFRHNETYDILSMARYELAGWIDNLNPAQPFNEMAWKEALDPEAAITYDEPPRLMAPPGESPGRLHLRRGDPPEARKAFALALGKRPESPFIKRLKNELNK